MTDNEIIKALKNELKCVEIRFGSMCDNKRDCTKCDLALPNDVVIGAYKNVLDLINRQKAEIKRLKEENKLLSIDADTAFQDGLNEAQDLYAEQVKAEVKSEAIKEFAQRLKKYAEVNEASLDGEEIIDVDDIDNLVKEMTEIK